MPRYIYEPADTHVNHSLHVNKVRVQVGVAFDLTAAPEDDPALRAHMERVPGRVVGGKRLPCIVPVVDMEQARALAAMSPAEVEMRKALDTLAEAVGLGVGAAGHAVVDAIKARLDAKSLGPAVEEAVRVVRETARTLDPNIPSDPQPGTVVGPPPTGPGAAVPIDAAEPAIPAAVDLGPGDPVRQYEEADLMERTAAALDDLCALHQVQTTAAQRKSKAGRVEALRAAGLVAEG